MPPLESHQTKLFLDNQCMIPAMSEREQKQYGFPMRLVGGFPGSRETRNCTQLRKQRILYAIQMAAGILDRTVK